MKEQANNISNKKKALKAAFPMTLPVMAGYIVLGFGYGLLMEAHGYSFIWSVLMSLTIFGGSMQFVGVDLISTGATIITTAIMTLLIQARHLFYGISMLEKYRDTGKKKPYLIFSLTDETYSLVCSGNIPEGVSKTDYFFFISVLDQSYWILGSALGGLFGQVVSINTAGIEFSMTALFVVILTDKLLQKDSRLPAVIGLFISFVCLMIFGANSFLIPSMIGITLVLLLLKPILDKKGENSYDIS